MTVVILFILAALASPSHQHPVPRSTPAVPYELVYATDSTTEVTGVITMWCRDGQTAEEVLLSDVKFWLNRTSAQDPGLRERADITAIEVDRFKLKFALTRHLEGYYTCGKHTDESRVQLESNPKPLISK